MRRERAVFEATRNVNPSDTIGMQREWSCPAERLHALTVSQIVRHFGGKVFRIIRVVESTPLVFLFVPPNELLALAPGLSVGTSRGAVIDDAAVVWPRESPTVA